MRFKCDTPKGGTARGVLGIVEGYYASSREFEEDHAVVAARRLDEFTTRICTTLTKAGVVAPVDHALKEHILKRVRVLSADGARSDSNGCQFC